MLEQLTDNLWVARSPQKFMGVPIGTRMTVVKLGEGELFLHSPIPLSQEIREGLSREGECVFRPNLSTDSG